MMSEEKTGESRQQEGAAGAGKEKYKRIKQRNVIGVETNISTPVISAIYKINQ